MHREIAFRFASVARFDTTALRAVSRVVFRTMALAVALLVVVSPGGVWAQGSSGAQGSSSVRFVDVTAASGVDFVHETGGFGKKWLPETMGSGVVVFDADGDGRLDLLFLNGRNFPGQEGSTGRNATQKLYRNRGAALRFEDVTEQSGLALRSYCMGGAAGDLDNDGDADLYLSCVGRDHLLENVGQGRFRDVTDAAGLTDAYEFGVSVALFDPDHDGDLDIYATRYVTWTPEGDLFCTLDGESKAFCTPEAYPGASGRFYENLGGEDGLRFADRTQAVGLATPKAKAMGVTILDLDDDGWADLAVSNDTQPNQLFRNKGDGTFEEIGVASGMAFSETGVARGGMGIDAADYDRSGRPSIVIGNFANEMVALYRNEGNRLFVDVAPVSQLGRNTLLTLTFGAFFFDYDLDGWLDLFLANGHLDPEIERVQPRVKYAQPSQLFRNQSRGRFVEVSGDDLSEPRVARGSAYGDLDGDGDLDLVVTTNGGPAQIFENRGTGHGNWLRVDLTGTRSNRDGIGALVEVTSGGSTQAWLVRTGGSYLSQSQLDPTFGLGDAVKAERVKVTWPSGAVQTETDVAANRVLELVEPRRPARNETAPGDAGDDNPEAAEEARRR